MRPTRTMGVVAGLALVAGTIFVAAPSSGASKLLAKATLIDDAGHPIGTVRFTRDGKGGAVTGQVRVQLPTTSPEFHGMHLHANAGNTGCVPGSGFTGVGGHWDVGGHTHGAHTGDLPSVARRSDGRAELVFVLDKFSAADAIGKALIVHAGPDNFGNVPLGPAANQYTDNGTAYNGPGGTAATGNSGARYACGVLEAKG